jgi:hypothetical protein
VGLKLAGEKTKGGTGGLGKPPVPPQVEETGERLDHGTKSVLPERRRKVLDSFYKIYIKKVLI